MLLIGLEYSFFFGIFDKQQKLSYYIVFQKKKNNNDLLIRH